MDEACLPRYNAEVLNFVRNVMKNDPKYKKSRPLYATRQAGVYHLGHAFSYRKVHFNKSEVPPLFDELRQRAETLTGKSYDTILFKVYQPGESLAKHQDVDGSDMSVASFTFATDTSQLCKMAWYKGTKTYSETFSFIPEVCSLWYMSGATNSTYSHRVLPADCARAGGLRVCVSFRQSVTEC